MTPHMHTIEYFANVGLFVIVRAPARWVPLEGFTASSAWDTSSDGTTNRRARCRLPAADIRRHPQHSG
jgi:hypothetical protein